MKKEAVYIVSEENCETETKTVTSKASYLIRKCYTQTGHAKPDMNNVKLQQEQQSLSVKNLSSDSLQNKKTLNFLILISDYEFSDN